MTDSLLQSYQRYTHTTVIPFEAVPGVEGLASDLLSGETEGFAIDATTYDEAVEAVYVGGSVGGTVAVIDTGTPANNLNNVALNASNLTNAGTSPKMCRNTASPYVRWSPYNLVIQSQAFGTTWTAEQCTIGSDVTTAPDGTSTADSLTATTLNSNCDVYQTSLAGYLANIVYTISIYAKADDGDVVGLSFVGNPNQYIASTFDLTNGVVGDSSTGGTSGTIISRSITSAGSGWYRCAMTGSIGSTGAAGLTVMQSGVASGNTYNSNGVITGPSQTVNDTIFVWGLQAVRGYNANPYIATTTAGRIGIPQSYDAAASKYGVLVEPAGTNLLLHSEDMSQAAWTKNTTTITSNSTVAPDGSTTADTVAASSTGSDRNVAQQILTSVSGQPYTFSFYAKPGVTNWVRAYLLNSGGSFAGTNFDLANGVTGTDVTSGWTLTSKTITAVGGGWYQCSVTTTVTLTNLTAVIDIADGNNDVSVTAGDSYILWGAQLENSTAASSYIPTTTASVTRATDLITALPTTYPFDTTTGTMYGDWKSQSDRPGGGGFGARAIILTDTGAINISDIALGGASQGRFDGVQAGGAQWDLNALGAVSSDTRIQIAGSWVANDFAGVMNGGTVSVDTSGNVASPADDLYFGHGTAGEAEYGRMFIYRFFYLPRAMSDAEIQAETA